MSDIVCLRMELVPIELRPDFWFSGLPNGQRIVFSQKISA